MRAERTDPTTSTPFAARISVEQVEEGLALVGSPDTVARQLEAMRARTPVQWLFAWCYNGLIPHAKLMGSIESFHRDVLSRVTDLG